MKKIKIPYEVNGVSRTITFKDVKGYSKHVSLDKHCTGVIYIRGNSYYSFFNFAGSDFISFTHSLIDIYNHVEDYIDVSYEDVYKFCEIKG